jgi:hypothetical protein
VALVAVRQMLLFREALVFIRGHLLFLVLGRDITAALEHLAQAVAVVAVVHQAQAVTEPRPILVMVAQERPHLLVVQR